MGYGKTTDRADMLFCMIEASRGNAETPHCICAGVLPPMSCEVQGATSEEGARVMYQVFLKSAAPMSQLSFLMA